MARKLSSSEKRFNHIIVSRLLLPAGFGKDKETQEVLAKRDAPELMREQELSEQDVINVLEIVLKNYPVDRNRLFLCGHSMGSGGTWFLGAKYADYWRALAPMSGPFVTRDGYPWQTCNCIGGWHYNTGIYEKGRYKTAETVVKQLVDIVSKNGNLLLSIPLRADGTYDEKEAKILDDLEAWMSVNGESIFGTRPWVKFGEGPIAEKTIAMRAQGFNDGQYAGMDARDIRFNQTKKYLYVTAMGWPDDGRLVIKSLAKGNTNLKKSITSVTLLGYGRLKARQTAEGLVVNLPKPTNYIAPVLKITK